MLMLRFDNYIEGPKLSPALGRHVPTSFSSTNGRPHAHAGAGAGATPSPPGRRLLDRFCPLDLPGSQEHRWDSLRFFSPGHGRTPGYLVVPAAANLILVLLLAKSG